MKPMTHHFGGPAEISDYFNAFESAHRIDAALSSFTKTDVLQYRGRPPVAAVPDLPYDAEAARLEALTIAAE